jgi:hypothetical protein
MTEYWCRFFDPRGSVVGAEKLFAESDAAAIAKAVLVFAPGCAHDFEIRDGKRLVMRHRLEAPPEGAARAAGD